MGVTFWPPSQILPEVGDAGCVGQCVLLRTSYKHGSLQVWAWDIDFKSATLQAVQNIMLRLFAEHELPVVTWTNNGGQFWNVLATATAIEKTLGVKPCTIPPREAAEQRAGQGLQPHPGCSAWWSAPAPAMCGGSTTRSPCPQLGIRLPEALWRSLRPVESRWKNLQL